MRRTGVLTFTLAILAAGCPSGDSPEPGASAAGSHEPADLFAEGAPQLAGPVAGVTLDETPSGEVASEVTGYPGLELTEDVLVRAYRETGETEDSAPVHRVKVTFSGERAGEAEKLAREAWGEPTEAPDNSGTKIGGEVRSALYWFNPDEHLYARLVPEDDEATLTFDAYTPLAEILGEGAETFGFVEDDARMLGASLEDLEAAYEGLEVKGDRAELEFDAPEFEHQNGRTKVFLRTRDGVVNEIAFSLSYRYASEGRKEALLEALEEKFGAPEEVERSGQTHLVFRQEGPHVSVFDQPESPRLEVTMRSEAPG